MALKDKIPEGSVMILYWVRCESDSRDAASSVGHLIRPAKGVIAAAKDLDRHGNRELHDYKGNGHAAAGHGVTILWPSGRLREIHADY